MNKEELIAGYFSKSLSPEAQKEFDHLMSTDPEFLDTVTFEKNLKTVIANEEQTQLKKELQSLEAISEEQIKTFPKNTSKPFIKWLVAASIIALLAIPSIWFFGQNNYTSQELYAANYEPYENVVYPIVRGNNANDIMAKAFIAYESENFESAVAHFNEILNSKNDPTIQFYKANALLSLNKTNEAISILSSNEGLSEDLKSQQTWYLALAYIKVDSMERAKPLLKELIDAGRFKTQEASRLLESLD